MTTECDDPEISRRIAEYHALARGPRTLGFALALAGVAAAIVKGTAMPALPGAVPAALIVAALGMMGIGFVRRARYHHRQIRLQREESKR